MRARSTCRGHLDPAAGGPPSTPPRPRAGAPRREAGQHLIASGTGREDPTMSTSPTRPHKALLVLWADHHGRFIGTMDYVAPSRSAARPVDAVPTLLARLRLYQSLTGDLRSTGTTRGPALAHLVEQTPSLVFRPSSLPGWTRVAKAMASSRGPYGACPSWWPTSGRDGGRAGSEERPRVAASDRPSGAAVPPRPAPAGPSPNLGDGRRQRSRSTTMSSDRVDSALVGVTARRFRRTLALAAVVLLVAVAAGVFFFRGREEALSGSFTRNDLVPFSFRYPSRWQQVAGQPGGVLVPRP